MQIQLKAQYVGPRGVFAPGSIIDVPDAEAKALIGGGYAFEVKAKPAPAPAPVIPQPAAPETASLSVEALETAVPPAPRKGRGKSK